MIDRKYDGPLTGALGELQQRIVRCELCPRLVSHRVEIAQAVRNRRKEFLEHWAAPVPSHGDPNAELLIVGLAPGAYGANRTGRLFTGDASSDFLMKALFRGGFATKPTSRSIGDGLEMRRAFQCATVRCVPPSNRPLPIEQRNCRPFLTSEIKLLPRVRAVLTLGRIAFTEYLRSVDVAGFRPSKYVFRHREQYALGNGLPTVFASYHPSPRNTNTGRLTIEGLSEVVLRIRRFLDGI